MTLQFETQETKAHLKKSCAEGSLLFATSEEYFCEALGLGRCPEVGLGTHSPMGRDAAKQHQDTGVEIPRAEVVVSR